MILERGGEEGKVAEVQTEKERAFMKYREEHKDRKECVIRDE